MTRELLIEGQHVDLAPDTNITLEFVNNIVGDIGKISLSRSYTVKIPKTTRNTRILDDPGRPGHESGVTRRFLNARYYRNGIDLIGPAQAYVLKTTPKSYEIALVWNTLESLQALSETDASINDLPGLPILPWLSSDGMFPDYLDTGNTESTTGAFFATYESGLGPYTPPKLKTAPHPSMRLSNLMERIFENAGVPYTVSEKAQEAIGRKVILAAPGHKPNGAMERESGNVAAIVRLDEGKYNNMPFQFFSIGQWTTGWDSLKVYGDSPEMTAGATIGAVLGANADKEQIHVLLNWRMPAAFAGYSIIVEGLQYDKDMEKVTNRGTLLQVYVKTDSEGAYVFADEDIQLGGWEYCGIRIDYSGAELFTEELSAYDASLPRLAINYVHETIDISKDNRFPLKGNLPDIKQWDFVKAVMAFCGLAPIIHNGALYLYTYAELLDSREAYDWTRKVDMTNGDPEELKYTLSGWAQLNQIAFKENPQLSSDPTANLIVEDTTIKESRKWFDLPFAASKQSAAVHYKVLKDEDYAVEDIDIEPRVFDVQLTQLVFRNNMQGQGLIETHYKALQQLVRTPKMLTANIRLHEVDIAQLDLSRPVYLGQYGQYYAILKIQTSDTDLCKVELLQLP